MPYHRLLTDVRIYKRERAWAFDGRRRAGLLVGPVGRSSASETAEGRVFSDPVIGPGCRGPLPVGEKGLGNIIYNHPRTRVPAKLGDTP